MTNIAIVLGTGQSLLKNSSGPDKLETTLYGEPSGTLVRITLGNEEVLLLPRHGTSHSIPPHKINYRANISALKNAGIKKIIAIAAVGGISSQMSPGTLVLPDQVIDYTWGREHTFYNGSNEGIEHIDFSNPYESDLRKKLLDASTECNIPLIDGGVYGAVQGPRLETAQEIRRMANDGCDLVGMTGMPEASLAREAEIEYICCAVVANWAAGIGAGTISMQEIQDNLSQSMLNVHQLLIKSLQ